MAATNPRNLPPDHETSAFFEQAGQFCYRAAYARSTDSRNNNEPGQDYLAYHLDGERFAFALCDGVSQSFYGDLAARILGNKLLEWSWALDFSQPPAQNQENLRQELNTLTDEASLLVREHSIPGQVPPMVRAVLEKKRALGSEATFITGVIDLSSKLAGFAWMGDSRLRLWHGDQELSTPFVGLFKTSERWSTSKGPVGDVHFAVVALADFDHLAAYSDGFSFLDSAYQVAGVAHPFSNHAIDVFIADAALRPSSDDISFIEIWTTPAPPRFPKEGENLAVPVVKHSYRNESHFLAWQPVPNATEYEIKLSSGNKTTLSSLKTDTCDWQSNGAMDANLHFFAVRAWQGQEPGIWSDFLPIEQVTPLPVTHAQTGPLMAPPPVEPTSVDHFQSPSTAPVETFSRTQISSPDPASPRSTFVPPPGAVETQTHIQVQPPLPVVTPPLVQPRQRTANRSSAWLWGLAVVLLFCLSGAMIVLASGGPENLAVTLGLLKRETPTIAATKTVRPQQPTSEPLVTSTMAVSGSETQSVELSPSVTMTVTPAIPLTPTPSETLTATLTISPPRTGQAATLKAAIQLLPVPNLQYAPVAGSQSYAAGGEVSLLQKYSDAGVDWYYVRLADGLEGWVMGKKLNLEGVDLASIPLVEQIVFPTFTPTTNP